MEFRAQGWLDDLFHSRFREFMLHASVRERLYCPTYVLMPDHIHLLWLGLRVGSDQINAMRLLRKYLQRDLTSRSRPNCEFSLQKQSHDSVLKEKDRTRGALAHACRYILENPLRRNLVTDAREWTFAGAIIPEYPFMHPWEEDYWPKFWHFYSEHREPFPDHPQEPSKEASLQPR